MTVAYNRMYYHLMKNLTIEDETKRKEMVLKKLEEYDYRQIFASLLHETEDEDDIIAEADQEQIDREMSIQKLIVYYEEKGREVNFDDDFTTESETENGDTVTVLQFGRTQLHEAIANNCLQEVIDIVEDSDLTARDNNGYTPLQMAKLYGNKDIIKIIEKFS